MSNMVRIADISWERRNQLLAAGWRGRPGDGMEALYAPPSRPLAAAARKLADQTSNRMADIPSDRLLILTITAVTPGASPGGNAVITVSWRGASIDVNDYCASYTPAVGHRVLCAHLSDHQLVVIDRMAG